MAIFDCRGVSFDKASRRLLAAGLFAYFGFSEVCYGFDWRVTPSLSASETFTDNINLANVDKKSGFVTEVTPGLSLNGASPWSNFNLNYRLQSLHNAGGRDDLDFNHQLNMSSLYQAVRNTLYIQTTSSISQQNISNAFVTTDNISGSGGRTENKNFSISPYWTPRFGSFGSGLVKVGYSRSTFDNATSEGTTGVVPDNFVTDSDTFTRQARLSSGSFFSSVNWALNYSSTEQTRGTGQDVRFEQYQGDMRYFFNRKFSVFGQAGFENNDYQTTQNSIRNGFFYTLGGRWSPSRWYWLEVGLGNNKHATLQFNPSNNFSSTITYRNKDVGLNTGDSWDASLRYQLQRANIGFNYSQETTTTQQLLTEQGYFLRDASGNLSQVINTQDLITQGFLMVDPSDPTGTRLIPGPNFNNSRLVANPFDLVNDVIIRKRGALSVSYQSGKSSYNASVYNERRSYELRAGEDMSYGISGGWQWQIEPRLDFYLRPSWQHNEGQITDNTRYDVALGLTRAIPINLGRPLLMNTRLEFRHINQSSDTSRFDYTENRATANFNVRF
ncbi:TIGR03016 family PEP-CTERM system-associated outer membrane protein [Methylomonas koyamae]|uniref:TIGR03016 family PEP-CTERM system-associated outer membrane protein n=1 Tax=Methylomonas koyamae TaxID=702114 RepID=UPI001126953B|nr:TIGR03016 family PEP-CTERM system-associated outer membrane protein [Methylomonas koyamae]TPQ29587.1 TIGR03016 family PEP-CTERM system-associated outer membrane protein [Methylomonas koyamae]